MAEDNDAPASRPVLLGKENAPQQRLCTHHGKGVRGDRDGRYVLRVDRVGEIRGKVVGGRDPLEDPLEPFELQILRNGEPPGGEPLFRKGLVQDDEGLALAVRKGMKQGTLDDREERGRGANSSESTRATRSVKPGRLRRERRAERNMFSSRQRLARLVPAANSFCCQPLGEWQRLSLLGIGTAAFRKRTGRQARD